MRPPVTDEPLLPTASLPRMMQLCLEFGVREEAVRAEIEFDIPVRRAGALLQAGASLSGRDDFGLYLGARHHLADLGALGFLLMAAPTAGGMLDVLVRYGRLIQDRAFTIVETTGAVEIYYAAPLSDSGQRRQDAEFSIAYIVGTTRAAIGSRLTPVEVCFEHEASAATQQHHALFGCPVRFNQPANRVVFASSVSDMPVVSADPVLFEHLRTYIESGFGADLGVEALGHVVLGVIAALLPKGLATLETVAHHLDLSPRTLQRKLADGEARFGDLVDTTRRELAKHYVLGTHMPMTDIAQQLGYSESAAFTRSYRRWYQASPRRHRAPR